MKRCDAEDSYPNNVKQNCRFCEDNGGKILVIADDRMNAWVQTWLQNMGVSEAYLGLRRDSDADREARAGCYFISGKVHVTFQLSECNSHTQLNSTS